MKKLFLSLVVVAAGFSANAQQFGLKGGVNMSSISDDKELDSKAKVGFYAGLFANLPIAESFSVQPEILYNNLGTKFEDSDDSATLNLDYISVPVMFQYKLVPQFYLEAGPQVSFLVSSKVKADNQVIENISNEIYKKENFNSLDVGVGIGAGFNITENFGINARYVAGFTDATKEGADIDPNAKNRNNAFQAGLFYKF